MRCILFLSFLIISPQLGHAEVAEGGQPNAAAPAPQKPFVPPAEVSQFCASGPQGSYLCDYWAIRTSDQKLHPNPFRKDAKGEDTNTNQPLRPADAKYRMNVFCTDKDHVMVTTLPVGEMGNKNWGEVKSQLNLTDFKIKHVIGADGRTDQSVLKMIDPRADFNNFIEFNYHKLNTGQSFVALYRFTSLTTGVTDGKMMCKRDKLYFHPEKPSAGPANPEGDYILKSADGTVKRLGIDMDGIASDKPTFRVDNTVLRENSNYNQPDGIMTALSSRRGMQVFVQWKRAGSGKSGGLGQAWVLDPINGVERYDVYRDDVSFSSQDYLKSSQVLDP